MVHTYVFKDDATSEDFNRLCRRIDRIAPGYKREEEQCFDRGVKSIRWVQGSRAILAEIEPDHRAVTVCSDVPLPKLQKISDSWKRRGRVGRFFCRYAKSVRVMEFAVLPLLLVIAALFSIDETLDALLMPANVLYLIFTVGTLFGWWLLIPAGMGIMRLADRKMDRTVRWTAAALPAVSAVYACCLYGEMLPWAIGEADPGEYPLAVPLAVYMAALPYLIINDKAKKRLEKAGMSGSRLSVLPGIAMALLAFTVAVGCSGYKDIYLRGSTQAVYSAEQAAAENRLEEARAELNVSRYGRDMEAVAVYAIETDMEDWSECPDEALEEQWKRLFAQGAADTRVGVTDDMADFYIGGRIYRVYPGEGVGFYGRNEEIFISPEVWK